MIETNFENQKKLLTLKVTGNFELADMLAAAMDMGEDRQPAYVVWDLTESFFNQSDEYYQASLGSIRKSLKTKRNITIKPRCAYLVRDSAFERRLKKIVRSLKPNWPWETFYTMQELEQWLYIPSDVQAEEAHVA